MKKIATALIAVMLVTLLAPCALADAPRFDGVTLKGVLRAVGIEKYGEVLKTDFPLKAYEMGKGII